MPLEGSRKRRGVGERGMSHVCLCCWVSVHVRAHVHVHIKQEMNPFHLHPCASQVLS